MEGIIDAKNNYPACFSLCGDNHLLSLLSFVIVVSRCTYLKAQTQVSFSLALPLSLSPSLSVHFLLSLLPLLIGQNKVT